MRKLRLYSLLVALALLLCLRPPAPYVSSAAAEESARTPFSLELPEVGGVPITAPEARIPTSNINTLRLKVQKRFADNINYGEIYTTINGEAANTICNKTRGKDGYVVNCNLESKPRFRLQPGKNVIEISATDRENRSYYASYVLLAGGASSLRDDATGATITLETVVVEQGADRQPPQLKLKTPDGLVRLQKATDRLKVSGTVSDESGALASVKVNNQIAALSGGAFESAVSVSVNSFIVIEAEDRAGNLARLTIPVRGREAAVSSTFKGRKFAVVIGVSRYKFHDGGLKDLFYADADARSMRDFLQSSAGGGFAPQDILYLENEQATTGSVRAALARFLPKAEPNDLIFLFIASHGSSDPHSPLKKLYFIFHDTKVADMPNTALPMSELQELLEHTVRAERIVVFIDACHSFGLSGAQLITTRGLEHTENNVLNLYASKLFNETGRAVLTSSDVNEASQESDKWGGHGVFTWALLEGLRGSADINADQLVTAGELFEFVSERVIRATYFTQNPKALAGLNKNFALAVAQKQSPPGR